MFGQWIWHWRWVKTHRTYADRWTFGHWQLPSRHKIYAETEPKRRWLKKIRRRVLVALLVRATVHFGRATPIAWPHCQEQSVFETSSQQLYLPLASTYSWISCQCLSLCQSRGASVRATCRGFERSWLVGAPLRPGNMNVNAGPDAIARWRRPPMRCHRTLLARSTHFCHY